MLKSFFWNLKQKIIPLSVSKNTGDCVRSRVGSICPLLTPLFMAGHYLYEYTWSIPQFLFDQATDEAGVHKEDTVPDRFAGRTQPDRTQRRWSSGWAPSGTPAGTSSHTTSPWQLRKKRRVVDPDPYGSETFSRIREKSFRIRSSSGYEMNFKYKYSEKLVKFDNFSTKMLNLKI